MVSIMDIEPKRQICDNRSTLSQSAVSQKAIDLEIPIPLKSPTATISPGPTSPRSPSSSSGGAASRTLSPTTTTTVPVTDTELAKRAMKLDLNAAESSQASSSAATTATAAASTSGTTSSAASTTTAAAVAAHSSSSSSAATTATNTNAAAAIIMKHRKLKERTFSDELGSPKSPAAAIDVVDDRKALRDALYQGIFHRHRRTIFAVGSFLRMLKSRNSSYNTIRSSSEGEDDNTR